MLFSCKPTTSKSCSTIFLTTYSFRTFQSLSPVSAAFSPRILYDPILYTGEAESPAIMPKNTTDNKNLLFIFKITICLSIFFARALCLRSLSLLYTYLFPEPIYGRRFRSKRSNTPKHYTTRPDQPPYPAISSAPTQTNPKTYLLPVERPKHFHYNNYKPIPRPEYLSDNFAPTYLYPYPM